MNFLHSLTHSLFNIPFIIYSNQASDRIKKNLFCNYIRLPFAKFIEPQNELQWTHGFNFVVFFTNFMISLHINCIYWFSYSRIQIQRKIPPFDSLKKISEGQSESACNGYISNFSRLFTHSMHIWDRWPFGSILFSKIPLGICFRSIILHIEWEKRVKKFKI